MANETNTFGTHKGVDLDDLFRRIHEAREQLDETFIQRTDTIWVLLLAELARANALLVGDPGTAKTAIIKSLVSHCTDATKFIVLCGSFATEDKVFGPQDIEAFKAGRYQRVLKGRLAAVTHAFLDEEFKSNEGTLNGQLTALNEREYDGEKIPLRVCFAATNWPEVKNRSDNVAALYDRFLLRFEVKEVEGEDAETDLLEAATRVKKYVPQSTYTVAEIDALHDYISEHIAIERNIRNAITKVRHRLAKEKIKVSGRRAAALQVILQANAFLNGRTTVTLEDFEALKFGLWSEQKDIETVNSVLETVDAETVQNCVNAIDGAMRKVRSLDGLSPTRRIESAAGVQAAIKSAAKEVQINLKTIGATKKGRERIAKAMGELKKHNDAIAAEVNAALPPEAQ